MSDKILIGVFAVRHLARDRPPYYFSQPLFMIILKNQIKNFAFILKTGSEMKGRLK